LEGRCTFERLDTSHNSELADWLLRIRNRLDSARGRDEEEARRLFYRLLNEGQGE